MNQQLYRKQLKRGLGSAITELMDAPDKFIYKDVVLWGCLSNLAFDWQTEGTKSDYLYFAAKVFNDPKYFLEPIIDKFHKKNRFNLALQLEDLLWNFAMDGNANAIKAIYDKRLELIEKLPKQRQYSRVYCERELLESIMQSMLQHGGFREFKKNIEIMGSMIKRHKSDECISYDWFMGSANSKFGEEKINAYFDKEILKQTDAAVFAIAYRKSVVRYRKGSDERRNLSCLTVDEFYKLARRAATAVNPRFEIVSTAFRFSKEASEDDLLKIAQFAIYETDESVKALCLLVFRRIDFPLDITPLLTYANSENKLLAEISVEVLCRFKDDRIRAMALKMLQNGDDRAFELFKTNYCRKDTTEICQSILNMKNISHHVQMNVLHVLRTFKSPNSRETLLHVYRNGDCAFCRSDIVRAMYKNDCLTDEILIECLYDSYYETRTFAERIRKKRGLNIV